MLMTAKILHIIRKQPSPLPLSHNRLLISPCFWQFSRVCVFLSVYELSDVAVPDT
jgi:hypothetical protein